MQILHIQKLVVYFLTHTRWNIDVYGGKLLSDAHCK